MMSKLPKPGSGLPPPSKRKSFGLSTNNSVPSDRESVSSDASSESRRFSGTLTSDRISPSPPPSGPLGAINKRLSGGTNFRKPSLSKPSSVSSSPVLTSSEKPSLVPSKPSAPKSTSKLPPLSNVSSPPVSAFTEHNGSTLLSPKRLSALKQLPRPTSPAILNQFQVGDRVSVESMGISGTLRFLGPTKFKPGTWAGIELDIEGTGKNDGVVDGVIYFTCPPKAGLFVLAHKLTKVRADESLTKEEANQEETSVDETLKDIASTVSKRRGIPLPSSISSTEIPANKSSLLLLSPTNPVPNVTGARASRYIGMTAAQLKKVNSSPAPPTSPNSTTTALESKRETSRKLLPTMKALQTNGIVKPPSSYSVPSPSPSPTSPKGPPTPSRSNSPIHNVITAPVSETNNDNTDTHDFKSSNTKEYLSLEQANSKIRNLQLQIELLESENKFFKLEAQQNRNESPEVSSQLSPLQIEELKKELNHLKNLEDQWETQRSKQSELITQLEAKVDEHLRELEIAKVEQQSLLVNSENQIKSKVAMVTEKLTKQLDEKAVQISKLQETINSVNAELQSKALVELELKEMLTQAELQRKGDAMNQDLITSLQTELESKSIEVGKLTARLDRTKSDFEKEKAQLIETISRIQQDETERIQAYKEQLDAVEQADMSALKSQLVEFERIIKDQEQMINQLRSAGSEAFDHYERELQSLKEENHSLQEQIKNIVEAGRQLEAETDTLRLGLEKASLREEELKNETNALQDIVDNYQVTSGKRKEEIQKLKAEVDRLTASQAESGEQTIQDKTKLLAELQELRSNIAIMEEEKRRSSVEQKELTFKLANMEEELNKAQVSYQQLLSLRESWASDKDELEAELANIKQLLTKDMEIIKRGVDNPEIVELTDTIKDLHAMVEEDSSQLEKALEEKDTQILKLNSELQMLRSQLTASEVRASVQDENDTNAQLLQSFEELKSEHVQSLAQQARLQTDYSALMEAQASLLEAHKQMEAECLKLMDEVERLHNESLEGDMILPASEEMIQAKDEPDGIKADNAEVNRLRGILAEKQTVINQMKHQYRDDIRQLQKRMTDLEITKQKEVEMQSKDIAELESIVEHKIFREAELEEQIAELKKKVEQLDARADDSSLKGKGECLDERPTTGSSNAKFSSLSAALTDDEDAELYCELCDSVGHDILSCTAYPIDMNGYSGYEGDADRTYCDNCEEFDLHWTDECPNQDETF